jgi:paraquat-inducible protein A
MYGPATIIGNAAVRDEAAVRDVGAGSGELAACAACDQMHRVPDGLCEAADCVRCGATVNEPGSASLETPLVLAYAALPLFAIAIFQPILSVRVTGTENVLFLPSAAVALGMQGYWALAVWVFAIAIVVPLMRLTGLAYALTGIKFELDLPGMDTALKLAQRVRAWAMADVFLVGALVAYTRLPNMAHVRIGAGGYAFIAAIGAMLTMESAFDPRRTWRAIAKQTTGPVVANGDRRACGDCGAVSPAHGGDHCWRCGTRLWRRKPDSINRTWALVVAAMFLYVPAMVLPVLVIDHLGRTQSHTIWSGVVALVANDTWPIAIIVFVASIVVPVMKVVGLALLLATIHWRWRGGLHERGRFFRFIERIGRWSNIDVFAVAILTALIQFGNFTAVRPGPAIIPFALVVVVTMAATQTFDPRLMWDAAAASHVD